MNARRIGLLAAVVVIAAVLAAFWLHPPGGESPPPTATFAVPGTPAAVYDAILPEIRDRIARDTKIVRIDSHSGITMRFSAYLEDHSVRLVEITLTPAPPDSASVTILSRRFSFLPGRGRDAQDATLETSLSALIRRRTHPPG